MPTTQRKTRKDRFERWWHKNHHNPKAQLWLVKNANRVASSYMLNPIAFEDVKVICKRYNLSVYKRLKRDDAWKLWKYMHPTITERTDILIDTAYDLDEKIQVLKTLKAEAKGYTRKPGSDFYLGG